MMQKVKVSPLSLHKKGTCPASNCFGPCSETCLSVLQHQMTDSGDSQSACQDATKGAGELLQAGPSRGPKDLSSLASRGYTAKPDRASSQEKVGHSHTLL